jgi:ribosome biogenesis GTPase A
MQTKHFQTMFWGWKKEVKIVDCPGLVCPSLAGMELQALVGSKSNVYCALSTTGSISIPILVV